MTPEELKQFRLIAKLSIERLHTNFLATQDDGGEETYMALKDVPEFRAFCAAGLHEALEESGFVGEVKDDAIATISVRQLYQSIISSITIGMDLATVMHKYGAKFPVPKTN